jgi:hypothetical protein
VSEILRRFAASLRHLGIGARLLIFFLMDWSTVVMDDYRVPGGSSLSLLAEARVPLAILSLLMLAHSFSSLRFWSRLLPLARLLERFAPVPVVGVVLLSAGAFVAPALTQVVPPESRWLLALLSGLETLGHVFNCGFVSVVFVGASFLIADVLLLRLVDRLSDDQPGREKSVDRLKVAVLWIFGWYFACCIFLAYNSMLDTSPIVTHRSEAVGVTRRSLQVGILSYEVRWLNFKSWTKPGQSEYIVAHGGRDGYETREVWEGMPLLMHVRAGTLGLQWVDSARIDKIVLLERIVKELPTAAAPRKALIAAYLAEKRWSDAMRHTREYQQLYPSDRSYVETVLRSLPAGWKPG